MKLLNILLVTLCFSTGGMAEATLVYHFTPTVNVVLGKSPCRIDNLKGSNALVNSFGNKPIYGCWNYVDDGKHVRIDWDNPNAKGDFAVIRAELFLPEEVQ